MQQLLLILVLAIASCAAEHEEVTHELSADDLGMSAEAYQYLDSALSIMESYSIRRDSVDWADLRRRSMVAAKGAQLVTDTYPSIQVALASLGDNHSYFLSPSELEEAYSLEVSDNQMPEADLIDGRYGYIKMYEFAAGDTQSRVQYALHVRELIHQLEREQPCGWIVDLRSNAGGAMWPMLAGLQPVLGNGCVGMFRGPMYSYSSWIVDHHRVLEDTVALMVIPQSARQFPQSSVTVAVLTGENTGSSGEAVTVAFRGRPNTRSFGEPTSGVSTGVALFFLPDSAAIGLACAWFVDRTGQVYDSKIQPDEHVRYLPDWVHQYENALDDPVIRAATEWLAEQEPCR